MTPAIGDGPLHVLVIHNDAHQAARVKTMLTSPDLNPGQTYTCDIALSLEAAVDAYNERAADAILLDVHLPDTPNLGFSLSTLLALEPEPCVVVMTSASSNDLGLEAVRRGAEDFLSEAGISAGVITRVLAYAVERHAHRARMAAQSDNLAAQNQQLDHFAATVAHDVRGPLGTAVGFIELVKERRNQLAAGQVDEMLDKAASQVGRAISLTDDLLSEARLPTENRDSLDLDALCKTAIQAVVDTTSSEHPLSITFDALPRGVFGRPISVRQILINLIANAARHAAQDDPRIHISAVLTARGMHLYVDDNGPGVPIKRRSEIFESGKSFSAGGSGAGRGLAICRAFTIAHGGRIWVEASPMGGARFVVELPARGAVRADGSHLLDEVDA